MKAPQSYKWYSLLLLVITVISSGTTDAVVTFPEWFSVHTSNQSCTPPYLARDPPLPPHAFSLCTMPLDYRPYKTKIIMRGQGGKGAGGGGAWLTGNRELEPKMGTGRKYTLSQKLC